jgi:hypothetical protein
MTLVQVLTLSLLPLSFKSVICSSACLLALTNYMVLRRCFEVETVSHTLPGVHRWALAFGAHMEGGQQTAGRSLHDRQNIIPILLLTS